jgi:hypothetical protein
LKGNRKNIGRFTIGPNIQKLLKPLVKEKKRI